MLARFVLARRALALARVRGARVKLLSGRPISLSNAGYLIATGVSMSLQLGGFPLVVASERGLVSAVRVLLVNGTDVNQKTQVSCLLYRTHFDTESGGSE